MVAPSNRRRLRAALYARKSTLQRGIAEEDTSVHRQLEGARAFAAMNGWDVVAEYKDDGVSGVASAKCIGRRAMFADAKRDVFDASSSRRSIGRPAMTRSFACWSTGSGRRCCLRLFQGPPDSSALHAAAGKLTHTKRGSPPTRAHFPILARAGFRFGRPDPLPSEVPALPLAARRFAQYAFIRRLTALRAAVLILLRADAPLLWSPSDTPIRASPFSASMAALTALTC